MKNIPYFISKFCLLALFFQAPAIAAAGPSDLGVYKGPGKWDLVPNFETWFGHEVPYAIDFYDYSSWTKLEDNLWLLNSWKNRRWNVVLSIGMLPGDGSGSISAGAAGTYDSHWRNIASRLIDNGYASAHIRLGWEMNNNWYPWAAAGNKTGWITYWQKIVSAMRSVSGANFRFTWCPNNGFNQFAAEEVYPGDSYVDFIGLDVYNQSWVTNHTVPSVRWNDIYAGARGVRFWLRFARDHGKPIVFPEWGTGTRPDGHGGGDDPYFIEQMYNVIATANTGYHIYWDFPAADFNAILSDGSKPGAEAKFKELFGPVFASAQHAARTYETDVLAAPSKSSAIHQTASDNNLSYAQGTILKAATSGDQVSYLLHHISPGKYNIKVKTRKTSAGGKWSLSVGHANNFDSTKTNVGTVQDTYTSGSWLYSEVDLGTWTATTSGDRWFRFTSQGKNAASSNYDMVFDYIKLTPLGTTARSGAKALKGIYASTSWNNLYQYVSGLSTGSAYTASFWLYGSGKIRLRILNASWGLAKEQEFTAGAAWGLCTYTVTAPSAGAHFLFTGGTGGTLYLDDCFFGTGTTNKLANPGFESGAASWSGIMPPETQVVP